MAYRIFTLTDGFQAGYLYTFCWWVVFAIYSIGHQLNRIRAYRIRKKRIHGKTDTILTDLPGAQLFRSLDRVVRIPFVTEMISLKHILGITFFIIVNLIFMFFAPFTVNTKYSVPPIALFDRRAAFIGMANWGFVFFLAQRNSLLSKMSGLTFQQLIPFHRIIARIGLAEFFPHFVYRIIKGYRRHYIVKEALFMDTEYSTGTIAMLAFFIMFATSFEYIRRNYFEVFYYSHVIFLIVAIIATCWHEPTCMVFFIPAVGLWAADRAVRTYKSWIVKSTSVRVDEVLNDSASQEGIVRVLFENRIMNSFKPGQYIFAALVLNGKKLWEYANWHPFTISEVFRVNDSDTDSGIEERVVGASHSEKIATSTKPDSTVTVNEKRKIANSSAVTIADSSSLSDVSCLRRRAATVSGDTNAKTIASFHIKALGHMTRDLVKAAAVGNKVQVYIDGPHGPHLHYQDYPVAAYFSTGIGVTPSLAMIKDIVERRCNGVRTITTENVYLIWAIKSTDELHPFIDMFTYWNDKVNNSIQPFHLSVNVYITRMKEGPNYFEGLNCLNVSYGERPDVKVEMDKIKTVNPLQRVFAHACGSAIFTRTVVNEAVAHNFEPHHETFEF
ncbi:ferric reductase like transmembrane component-domain-containing protein [Mycotypha africana]|uniref:ferric reductase like transmembrane component-domain-containing protein n=1 Tax=Mycotypha africana TaxID=64632 RepID=UPI002300BEF5|nr:ferric reductase like transmembrane component-domain-containing protein [Mycotypha africana]KAI8991386.1 ferric reductase like transmembrane component-domain-containing protein [Mycotypha africana]